jgi:hypothetical protein
MAIKGWSWNRNVMKNTLRRSAPDIVPKRVKQQFRYPFRGYVDPVSLDAGSGLGREYPGYRNRY